MALKEKKTLSSNNILTLLFLFSVFLLALNKIHDTDSWLHLSLGKLIWGLKALPEKEIFTYPSSDMPFSYSSWLFGLTCYLVYLVFDVYGLVLLKSISITIAFFLLLKDSLTPFKNHTITLVFLTALLFLCQDRFVLRPDIWLMVFLSFSIFSLNAYLYDNKKYIYLLPLVHMLWANSHSSITLMFVPFIAFIAGGVLQRYMYQGHNNIHMPSKSQLYTIMVLFPVSFCASLISPYFLDQYFHGSQYLVSDWYKQEIIELLPPSGRIKILLSFIVVAISLSFVFNKKQFSIFHLLLVVPFIILPFTAKRFLFLIAITGGPVFIRNISAIINTKGWGNFFQRKSLNIFTSLLVVLLFLLLVINATPIATINDRFGFGFDYSEMPKGALEYMDKKDINGRVLNSFVFGQYINWVSGNKRTVFIDARGYLSADLLEKSHKFINSNKIINELEKSYSFESMLVEYPNETDEVEEVRINLDLYFYHPDWALVYWDDTSRLYLKRGGKYDKIIASDEYKHINPDRTFQSFHNNIVNRDKTLYELQRNAEETGSNRAHLFMAFLYSSGRLYKNALESLSHVKDNAPSDLLYYSYVIKGVIYQRLGNFDSSLINLKKALRIGKTATTFHHIGTTYSLMNKTRLAIKYLEKALKLDRNMLLAYPKLIVSYSKLNRHKDAEKTKIIYNRVKDANNAKMHFEKGLKFYGNGEYERAIKELKKSLSINPSNPIAYTNIGYIYFDDKKIDMALKFFSKAIEIQPEYANAHYGLALAYKTKGEVKPAIMHFEKYLSIEPAGFYSRKAKTMISELSTL